MVKRHPVVLVCGAAIFGCLAGACDAAEPGNPTAQSTPSTATSSPAASSSEPATSTLPFAGAPKVANPLDAAKFLDDPCLALTSAQTETLEVGNGKKSQAPLGMACEWSNLDTGGYVNLQFDAKFREGLSAVYRANDQGKYVKFEPVADVAGFPGAIIEIPNSPQDVCTIAVGVSDDLSFQLGVGESFEKQGKVDPCVITKAVAPLVVQTMKAGG